LGDNLFEPLAVETIDAIRKGDGRELAGQLCKMQAVHSSAALGVNIFQYWQSINHPEKAAHACGFCRKTTSVSKQIRFEVKYPVASRFRTSPNLDIVIDNDPAAQYKVFAVECKFTEAHSSRGHSGLNAKYLDLDIWEELPSLRQLAVSICPNDTETLFLHRAQLIRHLLGLKKTFGRTGFRLLYLWYDTLGYDGWKHRKEIENFVRIARADGLRVHGLSFQELIIRLAKHHRADHPEYIEYITGRYL
jgi:hypothetical protein